MRGYMTETVKFVSLICRLVTLMQKCWTTCAKPIVDLDGANVALRQLFK